ncbi:LAMI_0C02916g1_1 [Lachancea mirantina]|uniref:dolichyl-phosphate beta-glucosyltransferase n=1 Tax=Lachancea mirantina TaxID=1230905 RepID=A0A1G4J1Y5_9SACH|nr:LAMI_0C02916g1_1 [Lachancea mirantina]
MSLKELFWNEKQKLSMMNLVVTAVIALFSSLFGTVYLLSHSPRRTFLEELEYTTCGSDGVIEHGKLPLVVDDHSALEDIELSVVVPSYNETGRILIMLKEAIEYLRKELEDRWEILIVDDGSKDGTADFCLNLAEREFKLQAGQLRVVKLSKNRGKGGAVKHGLLHIRGRYGLFVDADGASKFADVSKLLESVKSHEKSKKPALAIGSRAHMVNSEAVVKRSFIRNFLMYALHTLVFIFGIRSIKDTQCGFKLFNREAIVQIYPFLHTEGWIFDVEVLILALRKGIKVDEVPISWHEVSGSKMDLAWDSLMMAKDLTVIRMAYMLGIYSDKRPC